MEPGTAWARGALIGTGAFGTVSLAMNKSDGGLFAVKSTVSSISPSQNEYEILRSLDSPFIIRCLGRDHTVENGVSVDNLFMEYMPGGSIVDLLNKFGPQLDESVIRAYTRDILFGINYLHRQGIVHCDIKGKNVLVGANGVKLADFGSAKKIVDEGENLDMDEKNKVRGTPLWMAPEVLNCVEQGPASDIWSVGCTVVEMASGRPPFRNSSNPLVAMYRIACTETLPEIPLSLSPQGRDFLDKCFRRDRSQRWTSAQLLDHPFLGQ